MSEIKVDALSTVSGSGNITVSNNIAGAGTISGTNITASGTLGVTGNTTVGGTLVNTGLITASAGVAIGGTGAVNTLDDYEEGTWSPVLDFGGGSTGISYSTQSGKYTKIGNVVHFSFRLYLSSKGSSSGHAGVSGFPFAADAMPTGGVFQLTPARGWLGDNDEPIYLYFNSGTRMPLYQNDWDGTANAAVNESQFANNTELELTATYFTNS